MKTRPRFLLAAGILCLLAGITSQAQTLQEKQLLWMQEELPPCPEFDAWQSKTGTLPPDFESLPSNNLLPDPFTFLDGTPVGDDEESWQKRKAEIRELFCKYMIGSMPPRPAIKRVETLDFKDRKDYFTHSAKIVFGEEKEASVRVTLTIPKGPKGEKYPVFLSPDLSGMGNTVLRRGYISAGFAGNDFLDDSAALKELYPDYNFSKLARRAWLISIVLDYFETLPEVNMDQIAIYGYSRDGKMATIAAAFDERVDALVAGSTGVGGFVPWRYAGERNGGESIESTTRMFPDWFIPELRFFTGREDRLPVDANLYLSLIAPRAVLMEWGYNDEVASGWAQEQAYKAALPVYARYGAEDRLGLLAVPGFHGSNDMQKCLDFLDIQFGRSDKTWDNELFYSWDFSKWAEKQDFDVKDYPRRRKAAIRNLKDWEKRKPELLTAVNEMLGKAPLSAELSGNGMFGFFRRGGRPGPIEIPEGRYNPGQLKPDVAAWVANRKISEFGWTAEYAAGVSSKRISYGPDNLTADIYYPTGTPEGTKLPTVVWLHGFHYPLGYMWVYRSSIHPILELAKAGYAVVAFDQTGFGSRFEEYATFYDRYPEWSRLGRMVEDVSAVITAAQKDPLVQEDNISVLGFAMGGTVGLYASALDERIKNVVSICGFTDLQNRYEMYAMLPRMGLFSGAEERIPYNYADIIALSAPRGVLIVQPTMDRETDIDWARETVAGAAQAFDLQEAGSQLTLMTPEDIGRLSESTQINIIRWLDEKCK